MRILAMVACVAISEIAFVAGCCLWFHKRGYRLGRKDADNWWIGIEGDVEEARRRSWMEELPRKE